jgi:haloacetate dehalogenase
VTDWTDFAVHRVDTGDATLAVRVGGAGPPVVLLHGFPQHSLVWRKVAPPLSESFTMIVPDQRGMGASTISESGFTKTDMARDLAAVLDALGHERASVAGYDLGAGVAVAFARDYPERTERLAVMEFVAAGFGLERRFQLALQRVRGPRRGSVAVYRP